MPLLDARFFVTAVLTQRESGGNLAEVLDNLAQRHPRALPREAADPRDLGARPDHRLGAGRAAAGAWRCVLMTIAPEHIVTLMFDDPLGSQMIVGAVVLQMIGTLIIRKLVNIEY